MSDRSDYFKEYYKNNRASLLRKRRERHKNDPEYRANAMSRFKKRYDEKLKSPCKEIGYTVKKINGLQLFSIKYVVEMTGLNQNLLRSMEDKGIIPKSLYTDSRGWRLYTEGQIKLLASTLLEEPLNVAEVRKILHSKWAKAV